MRIFLVELIWKIILLCKKCIYIYYDLKKIKSKSEVYLLITNFTSMNKARIKTSQWSLLIIHQFHNDYEKLNKNWHWFNKIETSNTLKKIIFKYKCAKNYLHILSILNIYKRFQYIYKIYNKFKKKTHRNESTLWKCIEDETHALDSLNR